MAPGTMKDRPQAEDTKMPAIKEPRMFPTEVWEFHTPMMKPRLKYTRNTLLYPTTSGLLSLYLTELETYTSLRI